MRRRIIKSLLPVWLILFFIMSIALGWNFARAESGRVVTMDADKDGFPDEVEFIDEGDRENFRRWFAVIAESQFYSIHPDWPSIRHDCTGLVCFAYKEALKVHDDAWLKKFKYITNPAVPDIKKYHYPDVPVIGTDLFRIISGIFSEEDLKKGVFQPIVTARVLMENNCRFIGREFDDTVMPGDLLFFRYDDESSISYHAMILVSKYPNHLHGEMENGVEDFDGIVVYHTGPDGQNKGEVRKLTISTLNRHPDNTWHVKQDNLCFQGFFRLKILDYGYDGILGY